MTRIAVDFRVASSSRGPLNIIMIAICILFTVVAVNCQEIFPPNYRNYGVYPYNRPYDETPKPYSFSYNAPLDYGGQSSRMETADGTGRVEGSYTLTNDEGHTRIVDYVADEAGFRATIRTNEPGTESKNPADVVIDSSAAYTPYQYVPRAGRRPFVPASLDPALAPVVAPPLAPEVVPENVVHPAQPAHYNDPRYFANRNYYRPRARHPYGGY